MMSISQSINIKPKGEDELGDEVTLKMMEDRINIGQDASPSNTKSDTG
jgi:hypothetical protein